MIDIVKKFFGEKKPGPAGNERSEEHDVRVATCALLLEMANIDNQFSDVERDEMISLLKEHFGLSEEYTRQLIEISTQELENSVDLWKFAHLINRNYSIQEKQRVIEMLWEIVYADGKLDKYEDYLVHKLSNLLRLDHKQLIEAKLKVLNREPQ